MSITGTIGIKKVVANISLSGVEIKHKQNVLHDLTDLWLIGLQRVSKQLKTCDVVWVDGATQQPIVQSIAQTEVEQVVKHAPCAVLMLGMDPPPWSRLASTARKNNWQKEDWLHVFSDDMPTDDDDDDEWKPEENEDSDDDCFDY
tara:strand:- start:3865 stop:4299 length:435 start_codon:yes stop_codon:yes gene_type:complete